MMHSLTYCLAIAGQKMQTVALALLASATLGNVVQAQVFHADTLGSALILKAEGTSAASERLRLLVGLARIEADLELGMLQATDGTAGSGHFIDALEKTLPGIKEGLAAVDAPDLEGPLKTLAAGGDKDAMRHAHTAASVALAKGRAKLNPTQDDTADAVTEVVKLAVAGLNASGPTEVDSYQDAWAMLIVARKGVDLMLHNDDPALAKAAQDTALAFDDVILTLPDPKQSAPVTVDPAAILSLVTKLEALGGSV